MNYMDYLNGVKFFISIFAKERVFIFKIQG
jgi:hypothetical protein